MTREELLRDYRPNVPVTPELLEGMGWSVYGLAHNPRHGALMLMEGDGLACQEDMYLDWEPDGMSMDSPTYFRRLPAAATLRDLLVLLRAIGCPYSFPTKVQ